MGDAEQQFIRTLRNVVATHLLKLISVFVGTGIIIGISITTVFYNSEVRRLNATIDKMNLDIEANRTWIVVTEKSINAIKVQSELENNQKTAKAMQKLLNKYDELKGVKNK